jgi:uncharacterized repeat protein (TIGR01451 family)
MKYERICAKVCLVTLFILALITSQLHAQGWRRTFSLSAGGPYSDDGNYVTDIHQSPNGNLLSTSNMPSVSASYSINFAANSKHQFSDNGEFFPENNAYHHFSRDLLLLPGEDACLVLEEKEPFDGGPRDIFLSRYNLDYTPPLPYFFQFELDWHKPIFTVDPGQSARALHIVPANNGGFVALGNLAGTANDIVMLQTDIDGVVQWSKTFLTPEEDWGIKVLPAAGDGYLILKTLSPAADTSRREVWISKTDNTGNLLWEHNLSGTGSDRPADITATADGNFVISGLNIAAGNDVFLMKIDPDGNILWRQDYLMPDRGGDGRRVVEDANGDLVIACSVLDSLADETDIVLIKTTGTGTVLWERNIGKPEQIESVNALAVCPDGGYVVGGAVIQFDWDPLALLIKTDVNGYIKAGRIDGNVFHDLDIDCTGSPGDIPLENWIVQAFQDSSKIFYGNSDSLGNYRIECDTGDYIVTLFPPVAYWDPCANNVPIHIGYLDTVQVDFPLQDIISCPFLSVDHVSGVIRPCDTTTFTVSYCNSGTIAAEDAYVEISLDPEYTFLYADIPPSSQNGNQIVIPLGDLPVGHCGSFKFYAFVACDGVLGHVACSEVHIYPDSFCLPPAANWSGAFIKATGACSGDSVHFELINTGAQAMPQALDYIVIEDAVLLMQGQFQLNSSEIMDIPVPADGSTYHLMAQQEPGAPGSSLPLAAVEACVGSNGGFPASGFFNQFPQNDGDPYISVFCPIILNSFDPNDKQAFPTGFDDEHFILPNTELEYLIRFQNTGNDTAFRVVLIDSLSPLLDPASIRLGASSHPCTFEMEGNGALRFNFPNIMLPDSAANEAGSQGFVSFRIAQRANNAVGAVIENRADIYFDFNLPVLTNTVFHTVHEPFFEVVSVHTVSPEKMLRISAYPNPFSEQLRVEIPGEEVTDAAFLLYNAAGVLAASRPFDRNVATLQRNNLEPGIYFFTVRSENRLLGSGKIVVK